MEMVLIVTLILLVVSNGLSVIRINRIKKNIEKIEDKLIGVRLDFSKTGKTIESTEERVKQLSKVIGNMQIKQFVKNR